MAKKVLKKKVLRKPAAKKTVNPAVDSAREIWLAGLGAFSVAQQGGGRIIEQGSKLFEKLVAEGSKVETKTRKDVEGAVGDLRGEMESRVGDMKQQAEAVRKQATDNWDKLERIFEDRVAKALNSLGIPQNDELVKLSNKVDKLATHVSVMESKLASKAPAKKPATKKAVAKKAPAKKAPAKKAAAKKAPVKKAAVKKAPARKKVSKKTS